MVNTAPNNVAKEYLFFISNNCCSVDSENYLHPAKKNTHPCIPNTVAIDSKNFTITKASTHDMQKHIVHPMSRT